MNYSVTFQNDLIVHKLNRHLIELAPLMSSTPGSTFVAPPPLNNALRSDDYIHNRAVISNAHGRKSFKDHYKLFKAAQ